MLGHVGVNDFPVYLTNPCMKTFKTIVNYQHSIMFCEDLILELNCCHRLWSISAYVTIALNDAVVFLDAMSVAKQV